MIIRKESALETFLERKQGENMLASTALSVKNGFKLSPSKTVAVHFADKAHGMHLPPLLTMCGQNINFSDCCNLLGLVFDR